jgi:tetratricopeptide (TPR) repeat protein
MVEGEFALVKEHLEAAIKKPVSMRRSGTVSEAELYYMLADLAVLQRDEVALRHYAPPAEEMAIQDGHRLFQASAQRAGGVLHRLEGKYEEAEAQLDQALEMFEGLETRWQIGRTLYELAELAQAQNDIAQARDYFSRALVAFEEIKAAPDAARTRAALETLQ